MREDMSDFLIHFTKGESMEHAYQNLKNIMQGAEYLLTQIDSDSEIEDWVEDKISKVAENMRSLEAFYRK